MTRDTVYAGSEMSMHTGGRAVARSWRPELPKARQPVPGQQARAPSCRMARTTWCNTVAAGRTSRPVLLSSFKMAPNCRVQWMRVSHSGRLRQPMDPPHTAATAAPLHAAAPPAERRPQQRGQEGCCRLTPCLHRRLLGRHLLVMSGAGYRRREKAGEGAREAA
jgi:hypothetical protein